MATPKEKLAALANTDATVKAAVEAENLAKTGDGPIPVSPPPAEDAERLASEAKEREEAAAAAKAQAEAEALAEAKAQAEAHAAALESAVDFGGPIVARVTFGAYAIVLNGAYKSAERGQLIKGSKQFIERGIKLGGLEAV